jgi:hypothetical protein
LEPDVPIPPEVARFNLDRGESMVLAVALARRARGDDVEVVLDEWKGRRAAGSLGLPLHGTVGLLLLGKQEGRVQAVAPLLDELLRHGMYLGEECGGMSSISPASDQVRRRGPGRSLQVRLQASQLSLEGVS